MAVLRTAGRRRKALASVPLPECRGPSVRESVDGEMVVEVNNAPSLIGAYIHSRD